jgi:hypothetical protein
MLVRAVAAVAATTATLAFAAAETANAVSPQVAIAKLNAQRAANGIPAGILEVPEWDAACAAHNRYQRLNGGELTHEESRGAPGYTEAGAWAGENSVLSAGEDWSGANPWETAPIHLAQLLAPQLRRIGVDDSEGFTCATTWPGYESGRADALYSYPGNGTTGWPTAEVADESPFTPGDFVGLPTGTKTGLHLYVFADGPDAEDTSQVRIVSASLRDARGARKVRWVDSTTGEIGPFLPAGGILIPVAPLAPATAYHASVDVAVGGTTLHREWQFTTAVAQNAVGLSLRRYGGGVVLITVTSAARSPVLTLTRGTRKTRIPLTRRAKGGYTTGRLRLSAGTYRACAASGGGTSGYAAASKCLAAFRIG